MTGHLFDMADVATLLADLQRIVNAAPFRHMVTPGGQLMSVAMTNCGALVWGEPDRLRYHGVRPLPPGDHPLLGAQRINLTFRQAA